MRWLTSPVIAVLLLAALSCKELRDWREGQIAQSSKAAQGSQFTAPTQPVNVPSDLRDELPLDSSFTILTSHAGGAGGANSMTVTAQSPWQAEQTALWLVGKLTELGYDSGDNPSRVLEGATYTRGSGTYRTLYVKLSLNAADQCTVEYRASR